jgi:DNA invertase Pin-like site-specific DNA recombinase
MATSGRKLDDKMRQDAKLLKSQKLSISEVARRLGLSRPTVRKILQNSN